MNETRKPELSIIGKFRWYVAIMAIITIGIILIQLRSPDVREEVESKAVLPNSQSIVEIPDISINSKANTPEVSEVEATIDNLELPIPEDVEALARYYGTDGRRNIRDTEVFWQKGADLYIDFLKNETFEQSAYRIYIKSEFQWVTREFDPHRPSHPDIIRYLARTRRFNKLLFHVIEARQQGNIDALVETMDRNISRFMQERSAVEQEIISMIETEPQAFSDNATRDQGHRVSKLIPGVGSTGFETVAIPMSLQGAQFGAVANTFLLGLTAHPGAVKPIMDILGYKDRPIIEKLTEVFGRPEEYMNARLAFANRAVLADALDRILVACCENDHINQNALNLSRQYKQWRDSQNLPDREIQKTFTFDSPQTPYHLPGMITGSRQEPETFEFELPLVLWERLDFNQPVTYRLKEDTIQEIIDWAERFNAALD
jgi:hypothetical protein